MFTRSISDFSMELNKMKAASAIAAIGLGGLMSTGAMANDIDINQSAYQGLEVVQQHYQSSHGVSINFENPSIVVDSVGYKNEVNDIAASDMAQAVQNSQELPVNSVETFEIPNNSVEYFDLPSNDNSTNDKEPETPGSDGMNIDLPTDSQQVESCDREANAPHLFSRIGGWVLKGAAIITTINSAGAAVLPAYGLSKAGDVLLKNGCDEFDLKEEIYTLGKTVATAGIGGDTAMVVGMAMDYTKGKIEASIEANKDEATKKAEAENNKLPEGSNLITGGPSLIETTPLSIKINKDMMNDFKEVGSYLSNSSEPSKLKM